MIKLQERSWNHNLQSWSQKRLVCFRFKQVRKYSLEELERERPESKLEETETMHVSVTKD
jgi:hypothetical protein